MLTLHDLFIWKKFLDTLVIIVLCPGSQKENKSTPSSAQTVVCIDLCGLDKYSHTS